MLNGLKRLIYGATSYFVIKQGSCALQGQSFVELYREQLKYPTTIMALDIKTEKGVVVEFRICADGEKIFPFTDVNAVPDHLVNIIPIDVATGTFLTLEVRGLNPRDNFVVVLSEMDCLERR
jgi:hypothetical protein